MSYEFWVHISPAAFSDLQAAMGNVTTSLNPNVDESVNSASYPLMNNMPEVVRKVVGTYRPVIPNLYSLATDRPLHELVVVREAFQEWEERYYPDFWVGGAWDVQTGQPIGGMGSPWFMTPPEQDKVDYFLLAGGAPRIFP